MTITTGYADLFGRTVSNGLGTATSGQAYALVGTAADFSVASNIGSIAASTTGSDRLGVVNLSTIDVDISGQIGFSALPGTNLLFGGFTLKEVDGSNYYTARMAVSPSGALTLVISRRVGGVGTTVATVGVSGVTITAGTFYNLRAAATWSQRLQTNVLTVKFWAVGAAEPGGWSLVGLDASFTQYSAGTNHGLAARNEATVTGAVVRFQNVSSRSYHLPAPAAADPMCYDPAVTYPRQTAVQSLAVAVDPVADSLAADAANAASYPRVRVSTSSFTIDSTLSFITIPFTTVEFNIGTNTDLSIDSSHLRLTSGIWLVNAEIRLTEQPSDYLSMDIAGGGNSLDPNAMFRSNPNQANNQSVGGTGRTTKLAIVPPNPANSVSQMSLFVIPHSPTQQYPVVYAALTAVKISDYFT